MISDDNRDRLVMVPMAVLRDAATMRPRGYLIDVIGHAERVGDQAIWIRRDVYDALRARYAAYDDVPGMLTLLLRFGRALRRWARAGCPLVDRVVFIHRWAHCLVCPHLRRRPVWRCGRCGCGRLKLWLRTEQCPLRRW